MEIYYLRKKTLILPKQSLTYYQTNGKIEYIMKFLSIELNCKCEKSDVYFYLSGHHKKETLYNIISKYFDYYVHCIACHHEYSFLIYSHTLRTLMICCEHCLYNTPISRNHKMDAFFLKILRR